MIVAFIAAVAATTPPSSLDLELVCRGELHNYEAVSGVATTQNADGSYRTGTVTYSQPTVRKGIAKVSLHGASGQLVYPDGRIRALTIVAADEKQISASYGRVFGLVTWQVAISRMTGEITVKSGSEVAFLGNCSAAAPDPVQPKF